MKSVHVKLTVSFFLFLVFLLPLSAEEMNTSDWTDEQFESAISDVRDNLQTEFDTYQEILVNYKSSSEKAKSQVKKLKPLLVEYYGLLESWESACREYGQKLLDDGMFQQSPKVKDVRNLGSTIHKARGKYSSKNLPTNQRDIETLLKWRCDVTLPVRQLEEVPAEQTVQTLPEPKREAGDRLVKVVDGVEYAFRWCPAGEFMMGSPESEEGQKDGTQHKVTITKGFWMLETEVTQSQWKSVMGNNPSTYQGEKLPVDSVSWYMAHDFCKNLSQKFG